METSSTPTPKRRTRRRLRPVQESWARFWHNVRAWGTQPEERTTTHCHPYVEPPHDTYWRAIEIEAPPRIVWRWLCQMRVAPYSWDWIDNRGRKSPPELTPGVERIEVGQRFVTIFDLVEFESGRHLTMHINKGHTFFWGDVACTYEIFPLASDRCRVLFTWAVNDTPNGPITRLPGVWWFRSTCFPAGELFMSWKQLRTFKAYSEKQYREELAAGEAAQPGANGARGRSGVVTEA